MAAHEVPDTGHDGRGWGFSVRSSPCTGTHCIRQGRVGLEAHTHRQICRIGERLKRNPERAEAISLGGLRHVLVIMGILCAGLLLAFLIHMLVF